MNFFEISVNDNQLPGNINLSRSDRSKLNCNVITLQRLVADLKEMQGSHIEENEFDESIGYLENAITSIDTILNLKN